MNGEVNGTMEEPMEIAPASPVNPLHCNKITSEDCKLENKLEDSESTEINNHLENNEKEPEDKEVSVPKDGDNHHKDKSLEQTSDLAPTKETSNSVIENPLQNNCSNSNESYPESLNSNQDKTIFVEQKIISCEDEKSKDGEAENNCSAAVTINDEESDEEIDSEEDSSEEGSELSAVPRAEDTVSINSDSEPDRGDDTSQESQRNNSSEIIILENDNGPDNQNGNSRDSATAEIHEIISDNDNDDCVMTNDEKSSSSVSENRVQLRRSNRAIKRKIYIDEEMENGGDGSDIEEVAMEDPLTRKSKPIVVNDTKALVAMAAKQSKMTINNQKKEPTVVIIDTNSIISGKSSTPAPPKSSVTSMTAENLYQSIVARGTTVTPVSSKTASSNNTATSQNATQTAQPNILPSLTDDMFVVEAPSFIVPYVYEKPSIKPFREFVDILGKELEEQRAKEEQERVEKEKLEKEKREQEKKEKRERGEEVEDSEEEQEKEQDTAKDDADEDEKKKKKAEKKERRRRKNEEEDDVSWDGESSTDSEDDINSDEEDKTVVIKDKADSIEEIKDVTELITDKVTTGKSDNYFDCSLGKFFINIGLNFVQEYVQNDLLKQQNRKLYREKKAGHSTKATESSIASLMKNLEFSKENNAPYRYPQIKCEFCSFKTESMLVMAHHLETPHMKNNVYKCNFCAFEIRSPHDILYHMEAEHNTRGKLERAPAYHQCANCPFEDNGKGKLARHLIPCAKKFKPEINLAPPVEWEPPAKIPKITRARNNMLGSYQGGFGRPQLGNNMVRAPNMANVMGAGAAFRARGRAPLPAQPRPAMLGSTMIRGVMVRQPTPALNNNKNAMVGKSMHQPSISITPLPRQPQPAPAPAHTKSTFVICEICDGYIKDLEQLRNHMQWIHKVKIHPKMIYNRPPLNCQKCQFRFFTDQGLERHLLGSHGLVTSSMQEAANKGKDAGRCPVCGRVYQWKLLNHVARDHNLTLKPAHLSYKCTVCTATFGMYKQFENHVYSAHSVVAKRVMDKSKSTAPAAKPNDSLLKPLKINDEITIIPQPVKASTPTPAKDK
ncbi:MOG interacting and ectopic P-granules protein 1-like [Cydia pomonella]|uniref:MOG interacting and ectopic P-granules protein 1-like n=1 Tax=Cydia pomonella TaxID=82600 RepID=UPI002ADE80EA|nr:MOG interacting and ectopic P-granules protein 1-like [Cydia pomonella]